MALSRTTLVVVSGLPGTGKTTVASAYARSAGAAFISIDTIEQALVNGSSLRRPLGPVGYEVGYAMACEQLRLGLEVVAECVNPLAITRDAWARTAGEAGAVLVEVETDCSDSAEHRRRIETRKINVPGLPRPSWQEVLDREYERWHRSRLVLDTARLSVEACVAAIADALRGVPVTPITAGRR